MLLLLLVNEMRVSARWPLFARVFFRYRMGDYGCRVLGACIAGCQGDDLALAWSHFGA